MPPRINPTLILRRGVQGITLPQMRELMENSDEVERILAQFEEERAKYLELKKAADTAIAQSDARRIELAGLEEGFAARQTEAEDALATREAGVATGLAKVKTDRATLTGDIEAHDAAVARTQKKHRDEKSALDARRRAIVADKERLGRDSRKLATARGRLEDDAKAVEGDRAAARAEALAERERMTKALDAIRALLETGSGP